MNSEEYVSQVNRLMDLQNVYLQVFLAILFSVIGFIGFMQLKHSDKKIEQLKEKTKQETIKEIEKTLDVASLAEFKRGIQNEIEYVESNHDWFEANQLDFELTKMFNSDNIDLWYLNYFTGVYRNHILKSINNFNYFLSRVDSLITNPEIGGRINIYSPQIDEFIQRMSEFESTFNEKSEKLESFQKHLLYHRKNHKI